MSNGTAFANSALFPQPSYANFHDNVEYQWSQPGSVILARPWPVSGHDISTTDNNYWSDPASGTNLNIASWTAPNPMTSAQLFAALGCTDKATCAAQMVETPEQAGRKGPRPPVAGLRNEMTAKHPSLR